jgi:hypothetical protein
MRTFKGFLKDIPENGIYTFFSNIQGRHVKGAALIAKEKYGAIEGFAFGMRGRSYPICLTFNTGKVERKFMVAQIETFYRIARRDKDNDFYVMYSGQSEIGDYSPEELASIFNTFKIPDNVLFEQVFADLLLGKKKVKPMVNDEI